MIFDIIIIYLIVLSNLSLKIATIETFNIAKLTKNTQNRDNFKSILILHETYARTSYWKTFLSKDAIIERYWSWRQRSRSSSLQSADFYIMKDVQENSRLKIGVAVE